MSPGLPSLYIQRGVSTCGPCHIKAFLQVCISAALRPRLAQLIQFLPDRDSCPSEILEDLQIFG